MTSTFGNAALKCYAKFDSPVKPLLGGILSKDHLMNQPKLTSTGPLLVAIHGALMDHTVWQQCPNLFPASLATYMPDLVGHGQKHKRENNAEPLLYKALTPEHLAIDIMAESQHFHQDQLNHRSIIIIGHSLGGLVALSLHQSLAGQGIKTHAILLGDSPVYPLGDTASQKAARVQLEQTALGRNLLQHCFDGFEANSKQNSKVSSIYEGQLELACKDTSVTFMAGLLGPNQRNGFNDCGTFVSEASRQRLMGLKSKGLAVQVVEDAGHFVFHSPIGTAFTKAWIENHIKASSRPNPKIPK
jgi:hypothetical protein